MWLQMLVDWSGGSELGPMERLIHTTCKSTSDSPQNLLSMARFVGEAEGEDLASQLLCIGRFKFVG